MNPSIYIPQANMISSNCTTIKIMTKCHCLISWFSRSTSKSMLTILMSKYWNSIISNQNRGKSIRRMSKLKRRSLLDLFRSLDILARMKRMSLPKNGSLRRPERKRRWQGTKNQRNVAYASVFGLGARETTAPVSGRTSDVAENVNARGVWT